MKESLTITFSEGMSTYTARAGGYKATSTNSHHFAAERLIKKIYGYTPRDLKVERIGAGPWVATWTEPVKEAA